MTLGALLIGLATSILVVAYVLAPFRRAPRVADIDAQIEAWVAEARRPTDTKSVAADEGAGAEVPATTSAAVTEDVPAGPVSSDVSESKPANFCHQCGEPVRPHHRFCPNCGARLVEVS